MYTLGGSGQYNTSEHIHYKGKYFVILTWKFLFGMKTISLSTINISRYLAKQSRGETWGHIGWRRVPSSVETGTFLVNKIKIKYNLDLETGMFTLGNVEY